MAASNGANTKPNGMNKRISDGREAELLVAIYNKLHQLCFILSQSSSTTTP